MLYRTADHSVLLSVSVLSNFGKIVYFGPLNFFPVLHFPALQNGTKIPVLQFLVWSCIFHQFKLVEMVLHFLVLLN